MFKRIKEIRSKTGVLHFVRWQLFAIPFTSIKVYLHLIDKADEDADEHDHPWNFISLILRGGYVETSGHKITRRTPGSLAYKSAQESHRVITLLGRTYSLVVVWGERRPWGYQTPIGWVEQGEYRRKKNLDRDWEAVLKREAPTQAYPLRKSLRTPIEY